MQTKEHFPTRYGLQAVEGIGCLPKSDSVTMTHKKFHVISLTAEQNAKCCNYWYAVQSECRAHTAFHSRDHLIQWLDDRGLTMDGELAMAPQHSVVSVTGIYRSTSHFSYDEFFSLQGKRIRVGNNGDYTMGVITHDEDGVANIHYLNCNLRDRPVFDHTASRKAVG